jgi:drug/metabolite transporter (DMT)-like permease
VLALPVTLPASVIIIALGGVTTPITTQAVVGMALLGLSSMYLAFFAWYRGLADAGVARGGQVQQLQALLTLLWSAWLLGEQVTWGTVVAALFVVACVAWAVRVRTPTVVAPEE